MNHRHALWLTGPILLGLAAQLLARADHHPPAAGPPPTVCARWVQVGRASPLLCLDRRPATRLRQAGVSRGCLATHPPQTLRAGDRLSNAGKPSCHLGRMDAQAIAILGLAVDVNRADLFELATLPGVGLTLARRIVQYRRRRGRFQRPEDLLSVKGIGPRLLSRLRVRLAAFEGSDDG